MYPHTKHPSFTHTNTNTRMGERQSEHGVHYAYTRNTQIHTNTHTHSDHNVVELLYATTDTKNLLLAPHTHLSLFLGT